MDKNLSPVKRDERHDNAVNHLQDYIEEGIKDMGHALKNDEIEIALLDLEIMLLRITDMIRK